MNEMILTGTNNQICCGSYSAILGGCSNTVSHAYAGIFGKNISSVAADTFHVSCLNAMNTPLAAPYPPGTVMYKDFSSLVAGDRVLVIHS